MNFSSTAAHPSPNSAAAADGNRAAGAPSALLFRVRLPRLSGRPLPPDKRRSVEEHRARLSPKTVHARSFPFRKHLFAGHVKRRMDSSRSPINSATLPTGFRDTRLRRRWRRADGPAGRIAPSPCLRLEAYAELGLTWT